MQSFFYQDFFLCIYTHEKDYNKNGVRQFVNGHLKRHSNCTLVFVNKNQVISSSQVLFGVLLKFYNLLKYIFSVFYIIITIRVKLFYTIAYIHIFT